jgi:hypothetical protein
MPIHAKISRKERPKQEPPKPITEEKPEINEEPKEISVEKTVQFQKQQAAPVKPMNRQNPAMGRNVMRPSTKTHIPETKKRNPIIGVRI